LKSLKDLALLMVFFATISVAADHPGRGQA
jgi:hypothetical protein